MYFSRVYVGVVFSMLALSLTAVADDVVFEVKVGRNAVPTKVTGIDEVLVGDAFEKASLELDYFVKARETPKYFKIMEIGDPVKKSEAESKFFLESLEIAEALGTEQQKLAPSKLREELNQKFIELTIREAQIAGFDDVYEYLRSDSYLPIFQNRIKEVEELAKGQILSKESEYKLFLQSLWLEKNANHFQINPKEATGEAQPRTLRQNSPEFLALQKAHEVVSKVHQKLYRVRAKRLSRGD